MTEALPEVDGALSLQALETLRRLCDGKSAIAVGLHGFRSGLRSFGFLHRFRLGFRGGFEIGLEYRVVEIYGPESSGKTTLTLQVIASYNFV